MKRISNVHRIEMKEDNSWFYPVFTDEYGQEWRPKSTPTGNCWILSWEKFVPEGLDKSKEYKEETVLQKPDLDIKGLITGLETLVDGALPIVELWKAESPAQIEWKKRWVKNAREALAKASGKANA